MKSALLLSASLFCLCFSSKAQITKDNWLVGGSASFSNSKQNLIYSADKNSDVSFSILPNIGYFITDKFALGLSPGVSFRQSKSNNVKSNVSSYAIGPFAKYYLLPQLILPIYLYKETFNME